MNEELQLEQKPPRHRSPAWPFIPLSKAVERALEFYGSHRDRSAKAPAANVSWRMKPTSGAGPQTIAALKHYGIMEETDEGIKLSDLGLRIVRDTREVSPDRDAVLRDVALRPAVFAEIWQKWGANPKDADAVFFLVNERRFSEDAAKGVLANYKLSVQYANLSDFGNACKSASDGTEKKLDHLPTLPPTPASGAEVMEGERELTTGILSKEARFRLFVSGKIGKKEIERLIAKLEIDKEILADSDSETTQIADESTAA